MKQVPKIVGTIVLVFIATMVLRYSIDAVRDAPASNPVGGIERFIAESPRPLV